MKKFQTLIVLAGLVLGLSVPSTTHATTWKEAWEEVEERNKRLAEENKDKEFALEDGITDEGEGDYDIVYSMNMASNETNTCAITATATIPDRFGLDCFIQIREANSETVIEAPLYAANGYEEHFYVPAGTYSVLLVGVYDDNVGEYPMTYPEDFTVAGHEGHVLETTLSNYDEVVEKINNKITEANKRKSEEDKEELIPTKETAETMEETEEESFTDTEYEVSHKGSGNGTLRIHGEPTKEAYVLVSVFKGGELGTSQVTISFDNGQSFSEPLDVPLSGIITSKELNLEFKFKGELAENDTYTAFIPDPAKECDMVASSSAPYISLEADNGYPYDVLVSKNAYLVIEIRQSGGLGDAIFRYSTDNGESFESEEFIPADGAYRIDTLGITLHFEDDEYTSGTIYTADLVRPETINYAPYIAFTVIAIIAIIAILCYFRSKARKKTDYFF